MNVTFNKDLQRLNTFGMKVRAAKYIEYDDPCELPAIFGTGDNPQPILNVGEGSNLLFTADFPGTILHSKIEGIDILEDRSEGDRVLVRVGAGVKFDDFCDWAARKGLWGVENLSAIPGTVGASAVQNVGAYGVEAGDAIVEVECYDVQADAFVTIPAADCAFAYRDSMFKHNRGRYVVCYVVFSLTGEFCPQLEYGNLRTEVERNVENSVPTSDPYSPLFGSNSAMPLNPMLVRQTVQAIREQKLPDPAHIGSAGSFFKNPIVSTAKYQAVLDIVRAERGDGAEVPHYDLPDGMVKIPAAFLIEYCGFKGYAFGGAAVWKSQPLVLVNFSGGATPDEVLRLEKLIVDTIFNKFEVQLSPEVDHI